MTYDLPTLRALRECIERATGPNREIDEQVWKLCAPDAFKLYDGDTGEERHIGPNVTASIDAALALVERVLPGVACTWFDISCRDNPNGFSWRCELGLGLCHACWGRTAPLAILCAMLTALIEKETRG